MFYITILLPYLLVCNMFLQECPTGTYKNVTGSDSSLCFPCPSSELPSRAVYIYVRGISIEVAYAAIFP